MIIRHPLLTFQHTHTQERVDSHTLARSPSISFPCFSRHLSFSHLPLLSLLLLLLSLSLSYSLAFGPFTLEFRTSPRFPPSAFIHLFAFFPTLVRLD